ncbi:MAG: hypothetical protein EA381_17255, partial [Planctomycetaceae bacterium]
APSAIVNRPKDGWHLSKHGQQAERWLAPFEARERWLAPFEARVASFEEGGHAKHEKWVAPFEEGGTF